MTAIIRRALLILALLNAGPAYATGTVGFRSSTCASGTGTTVTTAAIDSRGSNFAWVVAGSDVTGDLTITDSLGNEYEFEYDLNNVFGPTPHFWTSYFQTPPFGTGHAPFPFVLTSAATTYTVTAGSSGTLVICVGTFSYVSVPPTVDGFGGSASPVNVTTVTSGAISTGQAGMLVLQTFFWTDLAETFTVSSPFTISAQANWASGTPLGMIMFYAILPTATTLPGGVTLSWGTTSANQRGILDGNPWVPYTSTRLPALFVAP